MTKFLRYIRTIKHLRFEQLFYQLYYLLRDKFRDFVNYKALFTLYRKGGALVFDEMIPAKKTYEANKFTFLNQSVTFSNKIDWEYTDKGKLWANHLSYFDYLMQEDMSKARGSALMYLMIDHLPKSTIAKTPYSISVRGINWIKFISKHGITRKTVDRYLYCQYRILMESLSHDRMGNHLLENGFSMLFGAYYFKGFELFNESKVLLIKELYEQILPDGGHFQLSPMYHQLILNRILDSYNLMKNNDVFHDSTLKELLKTSAEKMLGWLNEMTYENGEIPCLNDTTFDVAPSTKELFEYAKRLGIQAKKISLKESGYRRIKLRELEGIIDIGNIGPDYQTTHAHSDTFNFELMHGKKPFIVDTGTSTFIYNNTRSKERSTFSHNTVRVARIDQSEMYGSFRVGRRAKVNVSVDETNHYIASHNGYQRLGVIHQREFLVSENQLEINDVLDHDLDELSKVHAFLHFHPNCELKQVQQEKVIVDDWEIYFEGQTDIKTLDYNYALGFNKTQKAKMLQISFLDHLYTKIIKKKS